MRTDHSLAAALGLMLAISLIVPSTMAGDASDPEITDPMGDTMLAGTAPACVEGEQCPAAGAVVDITTAWVIESDDMLTFVIQVTSSEAAKAYGPMQFDAHFAIEGEAFTAGLHVGAADTAPPPVGGDASATPTGAASAARIETDQFEFDVLRADIGTPSAGAVMSDWYIDAEMDTMDQGVASITDRAPDSDGVSYTFTAGPAPEADAAGNGTGNVTGEAGNATQNATDDPSTDGGAGGDDPTADGGGDDGDNDGDDSTADNATADGGAADRESPGVALPLLALGLVLVVAVRRR